MDSLLPTWLEIAWAAAFMSVAASHLRHMAQSGGQRRAWHACHVLMALGMGCMYMPSAWMPRTATASLWQLVFAAAGTLAALWALGGVGRVSANVWLLTALDLGVMLLMWSGDERRLAAALVWAVVAYLTVEAGLWLFDAYRRLDGSDGLLNWRLLSIEAAGAVTGRGARVAAAQASASERLLGDLDITVSMLVMTVGMAYMIVAMLLM